MNKAERIHRIPDILADHKITGDAERKARMLLLTVVSAADILGSVCEKSVWIEIATKMVEAKINELEEKYKIKDATEIVAELLTDPVHHGTGSTH